MKNVSNHNEEGCPLGKILNQEERHLNDFSITY